MKNNIKILALITARGGSKGIPHKNIRLINDKPLIAYTINAARKCDFIDELIVSTDDLKIAKISREYGASVPFLRPKNLSTDKATSESAILHALDWLERKENKSFDLFILLQPTSPLRTHLHINNAMRVFLKNKSANALYSVVEVKQIPFKMMTIDKQGYIKNYFPLDKKINRRQDFPKFYYPNGAIYISKVETFKKLKGFDESRLIPYIMDSRSSIDIDEKLDLKIAANFIRTRT